MFPRMFAHINKIEGDLGSIESSLNNGVWVSNEGEDCPVGGVTRVNIQQDCSRGGSDCLRDSIDDLWRYMIIT